MTTFRSAFEQIILALTGLDGLPAPNLTPRSPDNTKQFPALYIDWETFTHSDRGDLKHIDTVRTLARVNVYIQILPASINDEASLLLLDKVQLVQDAIKTLTRTQDLDFWCQFLQATADYSIDATWASSRVVIGVGGFD